MAPPAATSPATVELAAAVSFYSSQFNLDERVQWLDLQCIEIAERQDRGLKSRKHLAEETKLTKKSAQELADPREVMVKFNALLKLYQAEIDSLSKRSKSAESGLGELYRALYQAPNPGPVLLQCQSSEQAMLKLKVENSDLRLDLAEFETEFAQLKNQDITIRELTERVAQLQFELAQKESKHREEVAKVAVSVAEELDSKREVDEIRTQLGEMEVAYEEQRRMCDSARNELFEYKFQSEERDQARQRELDQVQEELFAKQSSLQGSQESELARLRQRDLQEEEKQRVRREEEMAKLYHTLDQHRLEASRLRAVDANRERDVEVFKHRHLEQQQRDRERIHELEEQLSAKLPPSSLSSFPVSMAKDEGEEEEQQREVDKTRLNASLETLNAQLRIALADKENEVAKMHQSILDMEEQLTDGKQLARRLQDQVDSAATSSVSTSSVSPRAIRFVALAPSTPLPGGEQSSEVGVIGILQEQRDRFRRRMLELEQDLESSSTREKRSKEQLDRLRADNYSLTRSAAAAAAAATTMRTRNDFASKPAIVAAGSRSPLHFVVKFLASHSLARSAVAMYFILLHVLVLLSSSTAASSPISPAAAESNFLLRKVFTGDDN
ncbi:hypothetical protein BASA81_003033 [Batrachochytrium salamandrivorans]|nr:hypothetical protein BASA81_003033 [Batrachochytrium salamandrivorans]